MDSISPKFFDKGISISQEVEGALAKSIRKNASGSDAQRNLILYNFIKFTSRCNLNKNSELLNAVQKLKLTKFEPVTLNLQAVITKDIILDKFMLQEKQKELQDFILEVMDFENQSYIENIEY